ncbi:MAG: lysine--tRNA ligase [Candidatus Aminicenantes bacterium]
MTDSKNNNQQKNSGESSPKKKSDQEIARESKKEELRRQGVDLFPHQAEKTHSVADIVSRFSGMKKEDLEKEKVNVIVPGRIISLRQMGRATFFHIADNQTRIQAYLREDKVGRKNYELFSLIDIGDVVSVKGFLFRTRTGELTIMAQSFTFLAKCLHPLPEKWHGLQDVELRYRQRYLDLIVNPEESEVFRLRSALITRIREFFDKRGYVEVETPMMHAIPGGALARPFKTFHNALGIELYLRIAPELYLKRLIVGGFEKVYEINRNFRNEGISSEHNPEFTMLEFYQAYSDYHDMMDLTEELIPFLAQTLLGSDEIVYGEEKISLKRPWKRLKFKEAIYQYSGIAPQRLQDEKETIKLASILTSDQKGLSYGKALDVIFDKYVQHNLIQPTFVINLPKEVSPLAKASPENHEEAERFELVMGGLEVANAFSELTDPQEQKQRFEEQTEERKKGSEEAHPIDMDYVRALEYGLPPTGGEGIGIDRLAMLFTNRKSIREVILFPLLRPK